MKARIAPLAAAQGKSPHAWMVEALQAQVALAALREGFVTDALAAAHDIDAGGALFAREDVAAYLRGRATGGRPRRPSPLLDLPGREPEQAKPRKLR